MSHPLVSINYICYNHVQYVHETLSSALEQDYDNLQVVVADDGSTDGTLEVLLDFARRYPRRLVVVSGERNLGLTRNNNRALGPCRGRYIAFQDSDDLMFPGKIRRQVEWLEADPRRVLCLHDVEVFDERSGETSLWSRDRPLRAGSGAAIFISQDVCKKSSVMLRASALPAYGFDQRLPLVSDRKLWIDCLAAGGSFGYVPGVYGRVRWHSHNISSNFQRVLGDQLMTLALVEHEYPHLRGACWRGRARVFNLHGSKYFIEGNSALARRYLLGALFCAPLYSWRAPVMLALTLLPRSAELYRRGAALRNKLVSWARQNIGREFFGGRKPNLPYTLPLRGQDH